MENFRVVLADSRPVRRTRLGALIRAMPATTLVGTCPTLMEAYTLVEAEVPDLVLTCSAMRAQPGAKMYGEMMRLLGIRTCPLEDTQGDDEILSVVTKARAGTGATTTRHSSGLRLPPVPPLNKTTPSPTMAADDAIILIGASTGGVEALHRVLSDMPADAPPILVVQHIRGAFSGAFAERLDRNLRLAVSEAEDGAPLARGQVYVAPGAETHLHLDLPQRLGDPPQCRFVGTGPTCGHRPSVDELFLSALPFAPRVLAVLLTGMGQDGARGMLSLRRAGAHTIAQDRDSSTVYGMPRVAAELGAASEILPLPRIATAALRAAASRGSILQRSPR